MPSQSPVTPVVIGENAADDSQDEESNALMFVLITFGVTSALYMCVEVIRRHYFSGVAKQVEEMNLEEEGISTIKLDLEALESDRSRFVQSNFSLGGSMTSIADEIAIDIIAQ